MPWASRNTPNTMNLVPALGGKMTIGRVTPQSAVFAQVSRLLAAPLNYAYVSTWRNMNYNGYNAATNTFQVSR